MSEFNELREQHNNYNFRAPIDLKVTDTKIDRGLFIGSCFAESLKHNIEAVSGIPQDYVMYHGDKSLDGSLIRPISDYDYQVISLALRYILPEDALLRLDFNDEEACAAFFDGACERMLQWLEPGLAYGAENGMLTFATTFIVPQQNPMGRCLRKKTYSNICYMVQRLNEVLEDVVLSNPNCYLIDFDSIANSLGKKYISDETVWLYNHGTVLNDWDFDKDSERLEPQPSVTEHFETRVSDFFQAVWRELEASIRTVRQQDSIKMILVDLDDTMWRGIIGENRLHAVPVEGWPVAFAEALHYLKKRGIILGILSKNNEARIVEKWGELYSVLKLEDFAVRRINWEPKASNFEQVLQDVNLLPKNILFIDDNPVERNAIKSAFPDVRVLGANPYYFKQILMGAPETQVAVLTNESARRTEMIQSQIEREGTRKRLSRDEFLSSLNLQMKVININAIDHPQFARAFELVNKTNQFNTTGKRWTTDEISHLLSEGGAIVAFEAEDKFTRYGLISVAFIRANEIIQTVMSCRVIGMDVEKAVLARTEQSLVPVDGQFLANYLETPSNTLCRELYHVNGYSLENDKWVKDHQSLLAVPAHIEIIGED